VNRKADGLVPLSLKSNQTRVQVMNLVLTVIVIANRYIIWKASPKE